MRPREEAGRVTDLNAPNILRQAARAMEAGLDIAITTERADDKGWIAFAPEVRATAQGSSEEEAKANLRALLQKYPDLLDEPRQATERRVELIRL